MASKLSTIMEHTEIPISKDDRILYLGASHGVTALIISGIAEKGFVFCVEISHEAMKKLLKVCEKQENMCPLLFDANHPEAYEKKVTKVNVIYQDLAQKNQAEILKKNARMFLRKQGSFILIVKTQSIDTVKDPSKVLEEVIASLSPLKVKEIINLNNTHKKHYALIGVNP